MRKSIATVLLFLVSTSAFAQEIEMAVFDIRIVKDGELLAEPMVAVYLNKPGASEPGAASLTVGDDDDHVFNVMLQIFKVEESGAQVLVEYGYGEAEHGFSVMEEVTLPWQEETRLSYQRDSRSPGFEFYFTLSRESEQALKERVQKYKAKSSD